jgi:hypothetical protein
MALTYGRSRALVCAAAACLQLAACGSSEMSAVTGAPASPAAVVQPTFVAYPRYFIGSVIYATPGGSSLSYEFGSVLGATVSTTQSWTGNSIAGVSVGNAAIEPGNMFGGSTPTSVDLQVNKNFVATYVTPPSNSINHDYDSIWIFLGPEVNAYVDDSGNVTWGLAFPRMSIFPQNGIPVLVGCLRENSTIPLSHCSGVLSYLSSFGITPADYANMLGADPFADPSASPIPDPSRYVLVSAFSYLYSPGFPQSTYSGNFGPGVATAATSSYSYSVGSSVSASYDGMSLKDPGAFTWTHSSTQSDSSGTTGPITLTLALPTSTYAGPTTLYVYRDTIYKTFLFSFTQ